MPFVRNLHCQHCATAFSVDKYHTSWPLVCPTCNHEQENTRIYRSVWEIRQANKANNSYFFDPPTMRFFRCRVGDTVYYDRYFITSEQREYFTERRYSVRIAHDDGSIDTIGEFMAYASYRQAKRALDNYIRSTLLQQPQESE